MEKIGRTVEFVYSTGIYCVRYSGVDKKLISKLIYTNEDVFKGFTHRNKWMEELFRQAATWVYWAEFHMYDLEEDRCNMLYQGKLYAYDEMLEKAYYTAIGILWNNVRENQVLNLGYYKLAAGLIVTIREDLILLGIAPELTQKLRNVLPADIR